MDHAISARELGQGEGFDGIWTVREASVCSASCVLAGGLLSTGGEVGCEIKKDLKPLDCPNPPRIEDVLPAFLDTGRTGPIAHCMWAALTCLYEGFVEVPKEDSTSPLEIDFLF